MKEEQSNKIDDPTYFYETGWQTTEQDILLDLKILLKEYFVATFTETGNTLKVSLKNGQSFLISVKSCK